MRLKKAYAEIPLNNAENTFYLLHIISAILLSKSLFPKQAIGLGITMYLKFFLHGFMDGL